MCGVIGVLGTSQASLRVLQGLQLLQHRGQDAAGILTHDEDGFHFIRNLGLVESVFPKDSPEVLKGQVAIGHVRYATVSKAKAERSIPGTPPLSELPNVQPFIMNFPYGIGLVHNGNLENFKELGARLQSKSRRHPLTRSDSEAILNLFAEALAEQTKAETISFRHICEAVRAVHREAVGSYSVVIMIAGYGLIAFRDPLGLRPLVFGKRREADGKNSYLFASESTVAQFLDYTECVDVGAGELIATTLAGEVFRARIVEEKSRPCMFEWVYFASPQTEWEGVPVYNARIHLGRNVARKIREEISAGRIQPDLIVPVPETARIAAISLSEELGIPYREVLIKNRYISRTFILDTQDKREKAVQLKLSPVESEIRGKRIMLVDDSIVRGTTSKKLIALVRACGAKEVYFVSTAPPIRYPCHYGIDFPNANELIAHDRSDTEIEKALGADRVIYQSVDDLVSALQPIPGSGRKEVTPCLACLNREYPTAQKL
ncbi:MAG: amidophosphoribosyltransferase [Cryobacterium sp.]|nr:amidophosphoribosyltransferase [Oligoflexia bacterium]